MILTQGVALEAPLDELEDRCKHDEPDPVTLRDAERAHIVRILRDANGIIGTAANRLGVPRSTLFYKMRRLGIVATRTSARQSPELLKYAHA